MRPARANEGAPMTEPRAVLGPNSYGKAETRVVRVRRSGDVHDLIDLNVSIALSGDLTGTHLSGDNAHVLPTDTQKNTVFAFARDGIDTAEDFALHLARHFVATQEAITHAQVAIDRYPWDRLVVAGEPAPHSFRRAGPEVRTVHVEHGAAGDLTVAGIRDLVVLNSTGSEFVGFAVDEYTTLAPATDRILATAVEARWRYDADCADGWDLLYSGTRDCLLEAFAATHSRSLQQTLYAMGAAVIEQVSQVVEVRLALPNRHHFLVDLRPFGRDNPGEVFHAADRPYGLIEGTVLQRGAVADPRHW
jgi:urate oxidase